MFQQASALPAQLTTVNLVVPEKYGTTKVSEAVGKWQDIY